MAKRKLAEVRLTSILPHRLIPDSSVDTNHNRLMHKRVLSTTGVYKYVYKVCIKVLINVFFAVLADRASRLPKACLSWSYPHIL